MKKHTLRLGRIVACIMMLWLTTACGDLGIGPILSPDAFSGIGF